MTPSERRSSLLLALLLALAGCGEDEPEGRLARRTIAVAEVPAPAIAAAEQRLPGVTFEEAWQNVDADGQLRSFEVRGRNAAGKIREVRVSPTGEVLEAE